MSYGCARTRIGSPWRRAAPICPREGRHAFERARDFVLGVKAAQATKMVFAFRTHPERANLVSERRTSSRRSVFPQVRGRVMGLVEARWC